MTAVLAVLLAFVIAALSLSDPLILNAYGADSDELAEELEQAQEEADALQDQVDSLNDQLSSLSDDIEELADQIAENEEAIAALEEEIAAAQADIDAAQAAADEQYAALMEWIRISYENDLDDMLTAVLSAETFSDVFTQVEYVQSMSEFASVIIENYNDTIAELEVQKAGLKAQQEDLELELASLEELKDETSEKKNQVSSSISDTQSALNDANEEVSDLEDQLAEQILYEAELELQRILEESEKLSEILEASADNTGEAVVSTDYADLLLLAALIYCEAGSESYEGKLAVGCVVMNRVRSSRYPDTVEGVIYQSGQFGPAASGRLATVLANDLTTEDCYTAAAYVLAGNLPYPNFISFCSASISLGISTTVIGNHQFY